MDLMRSFILIVALIAQSCAVRSVYVPSPQNVSLPDSCRQFSFSGYAGSNTFNGQAAFTTGRRTQGGLQLMYGRGISMYEAQYGVFGYSKKKPWRSEISLGVGYTDNYDRVNYALVPSLQKKKLQYETYSRYARAYVQGAAGICSRIPIYKLDYSFSCSARFSYLYFADFDYREIDAEQTAALGSEVYTFIRTYKNRDMFLLEPCFTNKVGRDRLFAVIQVLGIIPYSQQIDIRYTKFSPVFLISIGIELKLKSCRRFR